MRSIFIIPIVAALAFFFVSALFAMEATDAKSGEALFNEHCAHCHPDGANIYNPQKTLHSRDRESNNIRTAQDIINKIRNIGPTVTHPESWLNMKVFDKSMITDSEAGKIADYVLRTFN